jgi:uncharacterized protein (TIGR01244 family)
LSELKVTRVTDRLAVSPQPRPEDFPLLASQGVAFLINNRPDGEEPGQLSVAEAAGLAAANGMVYRHIPIRLPDMSQRDIRAFAAAVAEAKGPVHAHCRSGLRSVTLWVLGEAMAGRLPAQNVQSTVERVGFDPKPAVAWLAANRVGGAR